MIFLTLADNFFLLILIVICPCFLFAYDSDNFCPSSLLGYEREAARYVVGTEFRTSHDAEILTSNLWKRLDGEHCQNRQLCRKSLEEISWSKNPIFFAECFSSNFGCRPSPP